MYTIKTHQKLCLELQRLYLAKMEFLCLPSYHYLNSNLLWKSSRLWNFLLYFYFYPLIVIHFCLSQVFWIEKGEEKKKSFWRVWACLSSVNRSYLVLKLLFIALYTDSIIRHYFLRIQFCWWFTAKPPVGGFGVRARSWVRNQDLGNHTLSTLCWCINALNWMSH